MAAGMWCSFLGTAYCFAGSVFCFSPFFGEPETGLLIHHSVEILHVAIEESFDNEHNLDHLHHSYNNDERGHPYDRVNFRLALPSAWKESRRAFS